MKGETVNHIGVALARITTIDNKSSLGEARSHWGEQEMQLNLSLKVTIILVTIT